MADPKFPVIVRIEQQISTEILSVCLTEISLKRSLLVVVIRDRQMGFGYRLLANINTGRAIRYAR